MKRMKRLFHGLTLLVMLVCLGLFEGNTRAGEVIGDAVPAGSTAKSLWATPAKSGRCTGRRRVRRRKPAFVVQRRSVRHQNVKHRATRRPVQSEVMTRHATRSPLCPPMTPNQIPSGNATQTAESVAYRLAGYTATADGATARVWYSSAYTVTSSYAYIGQMKVDGEELYVWLETDGTVLAGQVTEQQAASLPDIAHLMERFPDGGLGVVVADPDDFRPLTEPAVEVVEWTEPSR